MGHSQDVPILRASCSMRETRRISVYLSIYLRRQVGAKGGKISDRLLQKKNEDASIDACVAKPRQREPMTFYESGRTDCDAGYIIL